MSFVVDACGCGPDKFDQPLLPLAVSLAVVVLVVVVGSSVVQFSRYSSSSVMVTVGEELLPLVPRAVRSHQGLMKPWYFSCNVESGVMEMGRFALQFSINESGRFLNMKSVVPSFLLIGGN